MYRKRSTLRAALCAVLTFVLAFGSVPTVVWAEAAGAAGAAAEAAGDALADMGGALDAEGAQDGKEPASESEQGSDSAEKDNEEPGDPDDAAEREEEPKTGIEGEPEAMALDGADAETQDGVDEQAEPRAGPVITDGASLQAAIKAEGGSLPDNAFAQAIFDSIVDNPSDLIRGGTVANGTIQCDTSVVDMLAGYGGEIYADGVGIANILGIHYLRNVTDFNLENNSIADLTPLMLGGDNWYRVDQTFGLPSSTAVHYKNNPVMKWSRNLGSSLYLDAGRGLVDYGIVVDYICDGNGGPAVNTLEVPIPFLEDGTNAVMITQPQIFDESNGYGVSVDTIDSSKKNDHFVVTGINGTGWFTVDLATDNLTPPGSGPASKWSSRYGASWGTSQQSQSMYLTINSNFYTSVRIGGGGGQ